MSTTRMDRGYRTWRLAIAFFGGVGGSLVILDGLATARAEVRWPILLWPFIHVVLVCGVAYWPKVEQLLTALFRAHGSSGRRLAVTTFVLMLALYAVAVCLSLSGRGPALPPA